MKTAFHFARRAMPVLMLVVGSGLGWTAFARADDVNPKPFPPDRYAKMAGHSPFTPTAPQAAPTVAPPPAPKVSFAEKLTVTMLAMDHGSYLATVADPESSAHYLINSTQAEEPSMLKIEGVKWSKSNDEQLGGVQTTPEITLSKGTERAVVRYEPGGGGTGAIGGMPAPGAGGINRPFIPGNAGVRPGGGPVIPGSVTGPGLAVAPAPVTPVAAANNNPLRRQPIRSFPQPATAVPATAVRPVVPANAGLQAVRPGTAAKTDDDDDDDE